MARNVDCKCTYSFTCGYCLRNAPPTFFTPTDTSWMWSAEQCAYRAQVRDAAAARAAIAKAE